jgi:MerR family Zn(II)-responsive transcriptional regulator of zntA
MTVKLWKEGMYTIGRLARRAKVNTDSIRFYERQGLLSPANKTDAGYRLYTEDAIRRLAFIKHAQQCGFSLAQIRSLLQVHSGDPSARSIGYSIAEEKLGEIQKTLAALRAMSDALSSLLASREERARDPIRLEEKLLVSGIDAGSVQPLHRSNLAAA